MVPPWPVLRRPCQVASPWSARASPDVPGPVPTPPAHPGELRANPAQAPEFGEAFRFWLKLGCISFGGPTGQIALMHTELVERRRWVSEGRFLHALNYCILLPGPEAQQLATYLGWLLHRTWGGIAAGALFVLPSALLLWALSLLYVTSGKVSWVAAVFDGLKPAVLAIVAVAALRIGRRVLKNPLMWLVAATAFFALFVFKAPFPWVILGAGLLGLAGGKLRPAQFAVLSGHAAADDAGTAVTVSPSWGRALRVGAVCLALWWCPVLLLGFGLGFDHLLVRQGLFFSKAALVTFGGAYAVLPYVSQQAVEHHGWLDAGQMLDGLGLAETTPGPLIMVLQFVGFLGGWKFPEPFRPLAAATLGAAITTWTTFLPSFLFIFLGAPYVERLRRHRTLAAALSTITAAVVGVVVNLAVWFGLHVLFPLGGPVNWFGLAVAAGAWLALHKLKWDVLVVVPAAGVVGLIFSLVAGS